MTKRTENFPGVNVRTSRRRDGTLVRAYYFRRTGTRLPDITDPGFPEAYRAAAAQPRADTGPAAGSFKALICAYMDSPEFRERGDKTRKDYSVYLKILEDLIGDMPVKLLDRSHVIALRDKYKATPRKANYLMQVLRLLISFGIDRQYRTDNPAERPKTLKTGDGYQPWPDEAIARFRALADEPVRTAFELALYTAQRESDVLRMTWHDVGVGGHLTVRQQKTGTDLKIPIHPDLERYLTGVQRRGVTICTTAAGAGWKIDHFRHCFRRTVLAAGLDGMVFHGLRHTAARRLAEAGCTQDEIMSITGHKTPSMARRYTRKADQKRLADQAMAKVLIAETASPDGKAVPSKRTKRKAGN